MNSGITFHQLSESQKSIWYLEKAYPGTSLTAVAGNVRLTGDISYPALEKALNIFVKKNDSMRLRIREDDGVPVQYVADYREFKVDFFDFSQSGGLKALFAWDEEVTRKPLGIVENPLFYCALFKVSDEEGGYYMKMHHLISDAWTMGLLGKQVMDVYSKIKNGIAVDELPNPSYIDCLQSERAYIDSARFENDKAYWNAKFETLPEMTVLKGQKSGGNSIAARRKTMITPVKLSNKIREFCAANNVSVFTLFMCALAIYVNRVTGIEDIILGTPILNRTNAREKETTGMFISVAAPVRVTIKDSMNFITFSKAMLKENMDILRHQKYPYNYLIRDLKRKHKLSDRLFDIVLSYQNSKLNKDTTGEDYVAKWLFSGSQVESLVISINDREEGGNLIIDYDFLTDVFDIKEIEFIHQHLISLLWHALDNPSKNISRLEMISEREKQLILRDFNDTYADYPRDKTIHEIFEEQAALSPDRPALFFDGAVMSYAALNARSNALAHLLREKGVGPEKIVGIMTYRSFEMLVGILAILKAGGAYMPIDPDYPADRKNYMLKSSCTGWLLAQRGLADGLPFDGCTLDLNDEAVYAGSVHNLPKINNPKDLAYVMYTSGSTGRPKGVMVEHSSVVNNLTWMQKKYPLDESSRLMIKTAYTFDVSVHELFWWMLAGASLSITAPGDEKDPEAMIRSIEKHRVTTINFVPSMLTAFLHFIADRHCEARLASLRNVFAAGEALTTSQVQLFNSLLSEENGTKLSNLYGPTEATVYASFFDCSPLQHLDAVPIGKPIDNTSLYIFDRNQNLVPVGIPGELYIGGDGVARGYLYNPELTAERFVVNPYKRNEILYRTGDRARWYPKGDIEFLGRADNQVKVRGFRIELGEIEARLLSHPDIKEAAVKAFSDGGNLAWLAAYIVAEKPLDADIMNAFLAETLPDYMVPASYSFLEEMPKTTSGKVNRNALPKPEYAGSTSLEYTPPANVTEAALAEIWKKVLGIAKISVLENYTAVGGDSLNSIKIINEIYKRFGVELSPKDIFRLQTIRKQAEFVASSGASGGGFTGIQKVPQSDAYAVSSAQKRIFALDRNGAGAALNITGGLIVEGPIDVGRLREVFLQIISRHESLRTSFELRDGGPEQGVQSQKTARGSFELQGEPVQIIHRDVDLDIEEYESNGNDFDEIMNDFVRPFDLGAAPLLRLGIAKVNDHKHLIMVDMHHIISDGTSLNIFMSEFVMLYNGGALPELQITYKDYAVWNNQLLISDRLRKQKAYWMDVFSERIPETNLMLDYERPAFDSFKGDKYYFALDRSLTERIKKFAADSDATLYMVMLAALNVLLFKYTAQEDRVICMPVEGRMLPELRDQIGMFANLLLIRSYPSAEKTIKTYLDEIKEIVISAYENQDYPIEDLVDELTKMWGLNRPSMLDITFVLVNLELSKMSTRQFTARPYNYNSMKALRDIKLDANDMGDMIVCTVEYSTDVFKPETIKKFFSAYTKLLDYFTRYPDARLGDLRIPPKQVLRKVIG